MSVIKKKDVINHPSYYNKGKTEVITFIEEQNLSYSLGNVIKYVCRHDMKGGTEDLKKAMWYIQRQIEREEHNLNEIFSNQ